MASDLMDVAKTPRQENVTIPKRSHKMLVDFGEDDRLEDISVDAPASTASLKKSNSESKVKKEAKPAPEAKESKKESTEAADKPKAKEARKDRDDEKKTSKKRKRDDDDEEEDDGEDFVATKKSKKDDGKAKDTKKEKAAPKEKKEVKVEEMKDADDKDAFEEKKAEKKTPEKKKTPKKEKKEEKPEKKKAPAKKAKKEDDVDGSESPKKGKKKAKKEEGEDDSEEEGGFKWWEAAEDWKVGEKKNWKWRTLRHSGVHFPPVYVPHGVKMLYDGKPVDLTHDQEEVASYFARYLDTDHMKKPQFPKNFFKEFRAVLGKDHIIKDYTKCDFMPIFTHIKAEQEQRRQRGKEEKEVEKKEKEVLKEKYGFAMIDGRKEAVGNWTVEPPGLFLGRGDHPKSGMLKSRMVPEDVTLNLDEDAPIPPCPVPGHKWGGIVHNHEVAWLACWKNSITEEPKYVLFAATSSLKGQSDRKKFEKAKKLKTYIAKIREDYMVQLKKTEPLISQRATAIWVIDHLALRVGGEKGEDEADTVGCCSLRCEHIKLLDGNRVEFDFLGKDSMRYHNVVEVDPLVFTNLQRFIKGKKAGDNVFDELSPTLLNTYLQTLMEDLTAKVFRTYNASITMQNELAKMTEKDIKKLSVEEKVLFFNRASVQVAILCNHQRSVPKGHAAAMEKMDAKLNEVKEEVKDLKVYIKALDGGKKVSKEDQERFPSSLESAKKKLETLEKRLHTQEIKRTEKDDLKEVSTSTSKINYIDPRVSITWCKKVGLPIQKVFSKTVRDKFTWALAECENGDFEF